jgi:hypothetical protein
MSKKIKPLPTPFVVEGKGNSRWCIPSQSNKTYEVTGYILNNFLGGEEPYELQLFGPKTVWSQYTDSGIVQGVRKELMSWIQELYPDFKIKTILWSEQGMQPDEGWSFDIICKKEEK